MAKPYIVHLPLRERMNLRILEDLGFTPGEIKVYGALVKLQKSTVTRIIEESGVSSSKVYLILDKLIHKGLASFIMVDNIKEFSAASPENLLEYLRLERARLDMTQGSVKALVEEIKSSFDDKIQESAHIYKGLAGLRTAHIRLVDELEAGDEYVFFSVEANALDQESVRHMFHAIHKIRDTKKVTARGIALPSLRKTYKRYIPSRKEYQIRFHDLTLNQGLTIGKNRVIIETAHPDAFAVEIISKKTADSYKTFFDKIWKIAKP